MPSFFVVLAVVLVLAKLSARWRDALGGGRHERDAGGRRVAHREETRR
jgi:hypothetical protein